MCFLFVFSTSLRLLTWWLIRFQFLFRILGEIVVRRRPVGHWCVAKRKKARMFVEGSKTMPKRTPFKTVPACDRNRTPPAPEGTPAQKKADVAWTTVGPTT